MFKCSNVLQSTNFHGKLVCCMHVHVMIVVNTLTSSSNSDGEKDVMILVKKIVQKCVLMLSSDYVCVTTMPITFPSK